MRFDATPMRVRYGVPVFVTFSPDEAHNLLMIRLSRTRRNDPAFAEGSDPIGKKYCGRCEPDVAGSKPSEDDVVLGVPIEDVAGSLPSYDQRRGILARDSLACVDGFRMLIMVTYEYLFGMRVCPWCPDCNACPSGRPCQDLFGSNAHQEGGVFGRIDAGYTSIEAQKAGSLHAHTLLWVQCLHQHTPLVEILSQMKQGSSKDVISGYLRYKEHVARQAYSEIPTQEEVEEVERDWPEYAETEDLIRRPAYLTARANEPRGSISEWLKSYLTEDVRALQLRRQNHVHIYNPVTNQKEPLTACRRKDDPKKCKAEFPRTSWLIQKAVVLCQGLLRKMGMPLSGRRNRLGSLHGPMNHETLNATHPAMLAAHRFNSDVQLPYRFPISVETHDADCQEACIGSVNEGLIIQSCQACQDAQAAYACDYCNKRQPMAFNEVKECCKGHEYLAESLRGEHISYVAKRHHSRLMSDAYSKGIVRGQVENTNLRASGRSNDVTAAQCFRTCGTASFYGREYVEEVERQAKALPGITQRVFGEIDARNPRKRKVTFRNVAELYGQRPDELLYLSPYEFVTYWEPQLLKYPGHENEEGPEFHASLTDEGKGLLQEQRDLRARGDRSANRDLVPGKDYIVKEAKIGDGWLPYPDVPSPHASATGGCWYDAGGQLPRRSTVLPNPVITAAKESARQPLSCRISTHGPHAGAVQARTCRTWLSCEVVASPGMTHSRRGWMVALSALSRKGILVIS